MAERRMFAKSIVLSDAFLDMPMSARCLYFTLGMLADDDGFVGNPKSIMRQCGASQDDMLILLQKRYILSWESGVIVIKHWRMNNYLQNDRHKSTTYLEELSTLEIDERGAYTEKKKPNYSEIEVEEKGFIEVDSCTLSDARQARAKAKKESSLPTTFDQQIRNAFVGRRCPICNVIMSYGLNTTKPTIQHNLPISKGGKHELDNISVICQSCNTSIQNRVETPPYNTDEVKAVWECIGNVYTGKDSIGKDSINIYNAQKDAQKVEKDTSDNAQFEELWCAYPRKKDKARAHSCYNARLKDGWSHEELMQAVENYAEECKKEHTDTKYIKHPSTFLSASTPFVDYLRKGENDGSGMAGHVEGNALTDEQLDRIINGSEEDDELSKMFG